VRRVRRQAPAVRPAEAATLAAKLLSAPVSEAPRGRPVAGRRQAPPRPEYTLHGLPAGDAMLLLEALANQKPVRIRYVDGDGRHTDRLIEPQEIEEGRLLLAYCHLRQDDRAFSLNRIRAVTPP
jgi:predicted DNA-binding transcriptional regulator YafY